MIERLPSRHRLILVFAALNATLVLALAVFALRG